MYHFARLNISNARSVFKLLAQAANLSIGLAASAEGDELIDVAGESVGTNMPRLRIAAFGTAVGAALMSLPASQARAAVGITITIEVGTGPVTDLAAFGGGWDG